MSPAQLDDAALARRRTQRTSQGWRIRPRPGNRNNRVAAAAVSYRRRSREQIQTELRPDKRTATVAVTRQVEADGGSVQCSGADVLPPKSSSRVEAADRRELAGG
ncbi:hypothetical protein R1flu_013133 [Riccia fluitans]|uniref:Uncharacterized protein n=1 Tax=Riccia fluitans TaxID=41844 RepID=A0ABD1XGY9_9MARC